MSTSQSGRAKGTGTRVFLTVVFLIAVYFVWKHALKYFSLTEEAYGPYFWPRVNWVFPHVICGVIAILVGPFQFSKKLRAKRLSLHRKLGYVYLTAVLIGGVAGYILAATSSVNLAYEWGLKGLSIAWLLTSGMALLFILKKKTTQHKEWMIRSYVVTFAFVIFRFGFDLMKHYELGSDTDLNTLMSWASWSFPLLFAEAILQYRKTFKSKKK
jgi:uncharacterized membrane protein